MTKNQIENILQLLKDKKLVYVFKSAPFARGCIYEHYISKETDIFDSRSTYDCHKGCSIINNSHSFLPKGQFMFLKDNKRHREILLRFIKNHIKQNMTERKRVDRLVTSLPYA